MGTYLSRALSNLSGASVPPERTGMNPSSHPLFVAAEVAYRREIYSVGRAPSRVRPERHVFRRIRRAVRRHLPDPARRSARGPREASWDGLVEGRRS